MKQNKWKKEFVIEHMLARRVGGRAGEGEREGKAQEERERQRQTETEREGETGGIRVSLSPSKGHSQLLKLFLVKPVALKVPPPPNVSQAEDQNINVLTLENV